MTDATTPQPPPKPGQDVVKFHVIEDLKRRAEMGKAQYGTYLETHNGRDALLDAYQEALDLCMYLKQAILERDAKQSTLIDEERRRQRMIKEMAR